MGRAGCVPGEPTTVGGVQGGGVENKAEKKFKDQKMKYSPLDSRSKRLDFIPFEGEPSERLLGVLEGQLGSLWVAQGVGTWPGEVQST